MGWGWELEEGGGDDERGEWVMGGGHVLDALAKCISVTMSFIFYIH